MAREHCSREICGAGGDGGVQAEGEQGSVRGQPVPEEAESQRRDMALGQGSSTLDFLCISYWLVQHASQEQFGIL